MAAPSIARPSLADLHVDSMRLDAVRRDTKARKVAEKKQRFASNRPIDAVCERIITNIEQGWTYRSVLSEYTLRVEALWGAVTWGIRRLRAENRELRARVRSLEMAMRQAGMAVAATACLVIGISINDAWRAAVTDDSNSMERSFKRKRGRSRRRGLEDSTAQVQIRQFTPAAA